MFVMGGEGGGGVRTVNVLGDKSLKVEHEVEPKVLHPQARPDL